MYIQTLHKIARCQISISYFGKYTIHQQNTGSLLELSLPVTSIYSQSDCVVYSLLRTPADYIRTPDCLIWTRDRIPAIRQRMLDKTVTANDQCSPSRLAPYITNPITMKTTV